MKNKTIKLLTIMLLFVCMVSVFTGCKDEFCQPTIDQIDSLIIDEDNEPAINGATKVIVSSTIVDTNSYNSTMSEWQIYFERNDIDTTNFRTMEKYRCTGYFLQNSSYMTNDYYVYIYKFSDSDSANNCKNQLDRYDNYSVKQYGNIVVYADNLVAGHTFALIDTIGK